MQYSIKYLFQWRMNQLNHSVKRWTLAAYGTDVAVSGTGNLLPDNVTCPIFAAEYDQASIKWAEPNT